MAFGPADKAPAPLVSLIGKNQYTRCAKDIYYFSQVQLNSNLSLFTESNLY